MNRRAAIRLAAAILSMPLAIGSMLTYSRHFITSMLMLAACMALLWLGVRLDPRKGTR